jgi:hypothetical protein
MLRNYGVRCYLIWSIWLPLAGALEIVQVADHQRLQQPFHMQVHA